MTKFYTFFIFFITLSLSAQISVSESLNKKLADSLKPKNIKNITITEACKIVGYTSYINTESKNEYEKIANQIEKKLPKLNKEEKALVYYTLIVYSHNSKQRIRSLSIYYCDQFLKITDHEDPKNYSKLATVYLCKAGVLTEKKKFKEAIENGKLSLGYAKKINSLTKTSENLNMIANIYLAVYQFDKALYYSDLANLHLKKDSPDYINYNRFSYPFQKAEILFLKFLSTKNLKSLRNFETMQDSISKNMKNDLKGVWLSKWHLNNAYLSYFKQNYKEAEKEFLKSEAVEVDFSNWDINEYKTFKILLYLKTDREKEAISLLENVSNENNFYETLLYSEIYNYFKSAGKFEKANFYIEKLMASKNFENNYKHQGEIIETNAKHNVKEKQLKIEQLEQKAKIGKSQNQLTLAILLILLLISLIFIIFINRQNKIKRLKQEKRYHKKIKLMRKSLSDIDEKLFLERKNIGEEIHNDLLGDLISLRYLTEDYLAKTADSSQRKAFTDILKEINAIYEVSRDFSHTLTLRKNKGKRYDIFEYLDNIKERFAETNLLKVLIAIDEEEKSKLISKTSAELQKVIYSLIKESVSNTIKHSNAKEISISFNLLSPELLKIDITDNGKTLPRKHEQGIGLKSLRKQIQTVKGNLFFEQQADGFHIIATIPLIHKTKPNFVSSMP